MILLIMNLTLQYFKRLFKALNFIIFQQTRDNVPVLGQCWASVVDAGPALAQHRDNVSCLLGYYLWYCASIPRQEHRTRYFHLHKTQPVWLSQTCQSC